MTTKLASSVKVGEVVCESDGFQWVVKAIRDTAKRVTFTLAPFMSSMTARSECEITVGKSKMVRVAA